MVATPPARRRPVLAGFFFLAGFFIFIFVFIFVFVFVFVFLFLFLFIFIFVVIFIFIIIFIFIFIFFFFFFFFFFLFLLAVRFAGGVQGTFTLATLAFGHGSSIVFPTMYHLRFECTAITTLPF